MNTASSDSPTHIDPAAAREALAEIDRVAERTRKAIAHGPASAMLMLWGLVWAAGFAATELDPARSGMCWLIGDLVGILGSIGIALRPKSPVSGGKADGRIAFFWVALFCYAGLWLWMFQPTDGNHIGAFFATVPMFAYVAMGLWLSRFFVYLGVLVTVLTVVGLTLFPLHFNLWMAVVGGGSLFAAGVYIRSSWR
jgi:hypothetical protein